MNGYLTVKQVAEKWNMTPRNVQNLCSSGKIDGAIKFANSWAIPENADKPADGRVTSGKYRNWKRKQ